MCILSNRHHYDDHRCQCLYICWSSKTFVIRHRVIRLLCLLALLLVSCSKKDTKILDFGKFIIEVPNHWQKVKIKGIDSYVGGIKIDELDSAEFDLGPYSSDLNNESQNYEYLTIDKKKGKLVK